MTKYLTENFIDLSDWCFCPNHSTELHLNHGEGGFSIRPLVVMLHKDFAIEVVIMPHALPQTIKRLVTLTTLRVAFEGDIRDSVYSLYGMKILPARIRLISRYLVDIECPRGG